MKKFYARPPLTLILLLPLLLLSCANSSNHNLEKTENIASERYGSEAEILIQKWRLLLKDLEGSSELRQLTRVNQFFNDNITFIDDYFIWQKKDYWATPLETMGRAQGDCEDFTIAKYSSLLMLGIPTEKMRLTYVKAQIRTINSSRSQAHMVLAYYPQANADPWILDNLIHDINPASKRSDLTPVYSFNSSGLWLGNQTKPADTKPEARLSRWRDLLLRMKQEGM